MYTSLNHTGESVPDLADNLFCVVIRSNDSDTSFLLGNWKSSTRTCHVISPHPSILHHSYHLPPVTQYNNYILSTEHWIKSTQTNNNLIYPQFRRPKPKERLNCIIFFTFFNNIFQSSKESVGTVTKSPTSDSICINVQMYK